MIQFEPPNTVVLIEDDADYRNALVERLMLEGYETLAYASGEAALKVIGGDFPGVVVTDLRMGQEPGYVFAFRVAQRSGERLEPVRPESVGSRGDVGLVLRWTWRRLQGEDVPPPRAAIGASR